MLHVPHAQHPVALKCATKQLHKLSEVRAAKERIHPLRYIDSICPPTSTWPTPTFGEEHIVSNVLLSVRPTSSEDEHDRPNEDEQAAILHVGCSLAEPGHADDEGRALAPEVQCMTTCNSLVPMETSIDDHDQFQKERFCFSMLPAGTGGPDKCPHPFHIHEPEL